MAESTLVKGPHLLDVGSTSGGRLPNCALCDLLRVAGGCFFVNELAEGIKYPELPLVCFVLPVFVEMVLLVEGVYLVAWMIRRKRGSLISLASLPLKREHCSRNSTLEMVAERSCFTHLSVLMSSAGVSPTVWVKVKREKSFSIKCLRRI